MARQIIAVVLAALLSGSCFGQPQSSGRPSPREQVLAVGKDKPVEVSFLDGSKLRGWISDISDRGFILSYEKKNQLEKSQVTFDQIRAVKQVKSVNPKHTVRNILIGVGITLVAIGAIAGIGFAVAEK